MSVRWGHHKCKPFPEIDTTSTPDHNFDISAHDRYTADAICLPHDKARVFRVILQITSSPIVKVNLSLRIACAGMVGYGKS